MPFRLPFELGVAHYDPPPPERLQRGDGRVNVTKVGYGPASIAFTPLVMPDLRPEPEPGPGWARFVQSAGGIVGFPVPHRVRREPYVQMRGPVAWTTLALTIHADGTVDPAGGQERLHRPRGLVRGGLRHPHAWGDEDSAPIVTAVESALERCLSVAVIDAKPQFLRLKAGRTLAQQGQRGEDLFLLFDGVLRVEVDGTPVAEVGPGAILGEMALLHEGRRTATLRAVTPCRVAVVPKDRIDRQALEELVKGRVPRIDRQTLEEIAKSPHPARQLSGSLAQPPSSSSRRPRKRRCGSWRTRSRARR